MTERNLGQAKMKGRKSIVCTICEKGTKKLKEKLK